MPEKPKPVTELEELRSRINAIDTEILERLNERQAVAKSIGRVKKSGGRAVLDTRREFGVLERLMAANTRGDLDNRDLLQIFKAVIGAARRLQQPGDGRTGAPALYAVFGHPIGHSLSPLMHTAAFWAAGYNGVYVAVDAEHSGRIAGGMQALGIRGASVTIPHKTAVISQLDELDEGAAKIGAVNTILNAGGRLKGFNTDCDGAMRALAARVDLRGKRVLVIGAGGVARAAAYGIQSAGGRAVICNRTARHGEALAAELDCGFEPFEKLAQIETDVLINATSVGMSPATGASVVPREALRSGMLVMDLVYNPIHTRLLEEAAAAGCETIDGAEMFIHQGARQFEIWTGLSAPVEIMRLFVHAALGA